MPTVSPVQTSSVQSAISRAAQRTGVDFDYLVAQARLESGLDPSAKARTSSASGLYQFIDSTWLNTLDRHGAKHGMGWADDAIGPNGRVADPATRSHLLSLRYDAETASLMAAELTRDNANGLRAHLGREPQPPELYLAHFLGLGGAQRFLGALDSKPNQSAAALMPQAASANRAIFYSGGAPRSVGEVMQVMRDKVAAAYGQDGFPQTFSASDPQFAGFVPPASYTAHSAAFANGVQAPAPAPSAPAPRPSMAETLKATFAGSDPISNRATQKVAAAYGKFKAFGL